MINNICDILQWFWKFLLWAFSLIGASKDTHTVSLAGHRKSKKKGQSDENSIKPTFKEYFNQIRVTVNTWPEKVLLAKCRSLGIRSGSTNTRRFKLLQIYNKEAAQIYKKMAYYPIVVNHVVYLTNNFTYFDYLVVIDFEATCMPDPPKNFQHEIIQFPAVLVSVRDRMIVDQFCTYVKPKLNPKLTHFCTQLTGITQDQVDKAPDFPKALRSFQDWLASHMLGTTFRYAIVCDGSYDMGKFFYTQCELSGIPYLPFAMYWVNLRISFQCFYHVAWINLKMVLDLIGQPFQGRPHNGLDDARNIATVLIRLLHDGCTIIQNEQILLRKEDQEKNAYEQGKTRILYALSTVQRLTRGEFLKNYHRNTRIGIPRDSQVKQNQSITSQSNKENMISNGGAGARNRQGKKKNGKIKGKVGHNVDSGIASANSAKKQEE